MSESSYEAHRQEINRLLDLILAHEPTPPETDMIRTAARTRNRDSLNGIRRGQLAGDGGRLRDAMQAADIELDEERVKMLDALVEERLPLPPGF